MSNAGWASSSFSCSSDAYNAVIFLTVAIYFLLAIEEVPKSVIKKISLSPINF